MVTIWSLARAQPVQHAVVDQFDDHRALTRIKIRGPLEFKPTADDAIDLSQQLEPLMRASRTVFMNRRITRPAAPLYQGSTLAGPFLIDNLAGLVPRSLWQPMACGLLKQGGMILRFLIAIGFGVVAGYAATLSLSPFALRSTTPSAYVADAVRNQETICIIDRDFRMFTVASERDGKRRLRTYLPK